MTRETIFAEGDERPRTVLFQPEHYGRCLDAGAAMRPIAARYDKTLAHAAIGWVTSQPGVTTALLGARTTGEIEENAAGVGWTMSDADWAAFEDRGLAAVNRGLELPGAPRTDAGIVQPELVVAVADVEAAQDIVPDGLVENAVDHRGPLAVLDVHGARGRRVRQVVLDESGERR